MLCSSPCGVIRGYGAAVLATLLVSFPSADHFHAAYAAAGLEVAVLCGHQAGLHDPADGLQLCGICCHIVEQCSALGSRLACGGPQRNCQLLTVSGDGHTLGQDALQIGCGACDIGTHANGCAAHSGYYYDSAAAEENPAPASANADTGRMESIILSASIMLTMRFFMISSPLSVD